MKSTRHFLITLLFLSSFSLCAQEYATKHFPKYGAVIRHFFESYNWKADYPGGEPKFEKRKEGWCVSIYDNSMGEKPVKSALLWSASTHTYQDAGLKHRTAVDSLPEIPAELKETFNQRVFNEAPYQGYIGWEKDMIDELGGRNDLNDTLYFALARAYSDRATNLIEKQTSFGDDKERFPLPDRRGAMTPEQLDKFRTYEHKAIACYEKTLALNPSFESIVGTVQVKVNNEYMNAFLELLIVQGEQEAMKELPQKKLYDDFFISYSKNVLNSCERNGIVITNGDNDTYPLLYVQAALGFRTDVRVVNISLLQLPRYIKLLKEKVFSSPPVALTLSPGDFRDGLRDYVLLKENVDYMDLQTALQTITDTSLQAKNQEGYTWYYFPSNKVKITSDKGEVYKLKINRPYLLKNDVFLLDLLLHNTQRPLYFVLTMSSELYADYTSLLVNEGMVYHVDLSGASHYQPLSINRTKYYNNLMNQFDWKGQDNKLIKGEDLIGANYRIVLWTLADAYAMAQQPDSAFNVLNKGLSLFPEKVLPYDEYMVAYIECAFKLKNEVLAMDLARKTIPNLSGSNKKRIFEYLNTMTETYPNKEFAKLVKQYE